MKWFSFVKEPVLSSAQLERLSNIFDNAGQVVLGVAVLSPIVVGFDKVNWFVVVSGVIVTIACWLMSLWFAKKGEKV